MLYIVCCCALCRSKMRHFERSNTLRHFLVEFGIESKHRVLSSFFPFFVVLCVFWVFSVYFIKQVFFLLSFSIYSRSFFRILIFLVLYISETFFPLNFDSILSHVVFEVIEMRKSLLKYLKEEIKKMKI